jgi:putative oxidoreductase
MDLALLIARLIIGLGLAAHGAQKLFGWYGGYGAKGTGEFMASLGFTMGVPMAVLAGAGEFGGGLLTAIGILGPIGPALIIAVMTEAIITVHIKNGWFASKNGVEFPLTVAAGALMLAFSGPGEYSLAELFGGMSWGWSTQVTWIIVVVAVLGPIAIAKFLRKS